jgi:chemotaxis signal transduction protein
MNSHKLLRPSEALGRPFIDPALGDDAVVAAPSAEKSIIRRLGFRVGEIGLLIAPNTVSELTDPLPICPIPNTAGWLMGLVNLRGNLVPVFDMAMLLGMEKDPEKRNQMMLILGQGEAAAGIMIDDLPAHQVLTPDDKLNSLPALPGVIKPYIPSGYEKNGEIWFNFDHQAFFDALGNRIAL